MTRKEARRRILQASRPLTSETTGAREVREDRAQVLSGLLKLEWFATAERTGPDERVAAQDMLAVLGIAEEGNETNG